MVQGYNFSSVLNFEKQFYVLAIFFTVLFLPKKKLLDFFGGKFWGHFHLKGYGPGCWREKPSTLRISLQRKIQYTPSDSSRDVFFHELRDEVEGIQPKKGFLN